MLLPGPLRNILRGSKGASTPKGPPSVTSGRSAFPPRHSGEEVTSTRSSRGLEEFFNHIRDQSGLTILDLGGATQQNVSFITNLGHRLYSEDLVRMINDTFTDDISAQSNPGQMDYFMRHALDYPERQFDGVLIWDVLEYLAPALLNTVVDRLYKI